MITEVREYFKKVIRTIDPDLKYDKLLDSTEKVSSTMLDRTFKFYFGTMKPETIDGTIYSELPVEIVIYKKIGTNSSDDFDKAYCKAIDIHALAQNRSEYDQEDTIKRVECIEITPEQMENDSNAYRFILKFTVSLGYVYNK